MSSVDVIVPCYRYGHFLRECVESVLAQSGPSLRVLIIDDCSPDNTAKVADDLAKQDSRVTWLKHSTNKGHIATYNEGIAWASADYMVLLSADDYLLPGALRRATHLMDSHIEIGFTFGNAISLNDSCGGAGPTDIVSEETGWRILKGLEFIELNGARNSVLTPTVMVRTELQKKLGGYRPELPHSGDMEMWLRLAAHSSVGVLEAYQAVYRRHPANMSLAYSPEHDLAQRRVALDLFFQTSADALPDAERLHQVLVWSLACQAVQRASSAFNEGKMELSERLSEFALDIDPDVKNSVPWALLLCKQHLGLGVWHVLQPAIASVRHVVLPLKRFVKGGENWRRP
jgi:GT2 family glycosyltransferase